MGLSQLARNFLESEKRTNSMMLVENPWSWHRRARCAVAQMVLVWEKAGNFAAKGKMPAKSCW